MRILVHDYSGHPFQAQLSRSLAARGHDVVHSTCPAYVSGKGNLASGADEPRLRFVKVGSGTVRKSSFVRRSFQEVGFGIALVAQLRRERPDVVLMSNAPIPTLVIVALYLFGRRIPWVLWHQDVVAVAIASFAGDKLGRIWHLTARVIGVGERWCARRAAHVVVIADSFVPVHERWGTADKVTVIPNWAPLDEIVPTERSNAWAREHDLVGTRTLLYSGTLGLKHDPALLAELVHGVRRLGVDARLVVVNTGVAEDVVRRSCAHLGVPLTLVPFQPYERLSEVLGAGDVLVVLLEKSAGAFSVPSKTLSYLCAGRPVVGLMPAENQAAQLLERAGCGVFPPDHSSVDAAARWVAEVLDDEALAQQLAASTRSLAESEFSLEQCADRFDELLVAAADPRRRRRLRSPDPRGEGFSRPRVAAAQDSAHADGHDYANGSPHLAHPALRAQVSAQLTKLVRTTVASKGTCSVLEIGAGHGTFTDTLLAAGARVTVTETSRASADLLREKYAGNAAVSVVHDMSGEDVLAGQARYDGAACISVLHHIPDYVGFASRLSEVVEPGGWLYSVQDPLYYPRRGRVAHVASRSAYFAWRLAQGNYGRGLATRVRRLRGKYSDTEPSDLVEYHVMRDGVDELALEQALAERFGRVEIFRYWSTQGRAFQRLGARTCLTSDFGLSATDRQLST